MYFNSFLYILLFLPIVALVCQFARRLQVPRAPQICILLASILFYGWSKPSNLGYLLASILVNWQLARLIATASGLRRKRLLQLGLALNIGFLCVFKYVNFIAGSIPFLAQHRIALPQLAFPLGISFFTLAQIMYLVDCYEQLIPASSLFDHATFVSFFPCVISGPINRSKRILHQFTALNAPTGPSAETVARALFLFSIGLIKKVVLADAFSHLADMGFNNIHSLSALEAWFVASAYGFQLFFDFSGYSDMAIGSALLIGIEVPRNFDAPFRSLSIIEFWQRWHITLSSFITTYLYTPILRLFRRATLATASIATLLAMTIAGLWHGPAWTFVIFGAIHGVGLVVNQFWRKKKMPALPDWASRLVTFALLDLGFVFFRAPNLAAALAFVPRMVSMTHPFSFSNIAGLAQEDLMTKLFAVLQVVGVGVLIFGKSSDQLAREFKLDWRTSAVTVACALLAIVYLNSSVSVPFVYFAF